LDEEIDRLNTKIDSLEADAAELKQKIATANEQMGELQKNIDMETAELTKAETAFAKTDGELADNIAAVEDALQAVRESQTKMTNAKLNFAEMQGLVSNKLNRRKGSINSQLQASVLDAILAAGKPGQPTTYEYHANDVVAILKNLLARFKAVRQSKHTDSSRELGIMQLNIQGMSQSRTFHAEAKAENERVLAEKLLVREQSASDMADEEVDKKADQSFLGVLQANCQEKAKLFHQRSEIRTAEVGAISNALEELQKKAAPSYSVTKRFAGEQETKTSMSFLQVRGRSSEKRMQKVIRLLSHAAKQLNSSVLLSTTLSLNLTGDNFVKVREMIKDLIARLESDADVEATQKSFCDEQMTKGVKTRDDFKAEVEGLSSDLMKLKSDIAAKRMKIAEEQSAISFLQKSLLDATQLRTTEKSQNLKDVSVAKEGLEATRSALTFLREFYESSVSMSQVKYTQPNSDRDGKTVGELAPDVFDAEYQGAKESTSGIFGLLEVIITDFEHTVSATMGVESAANEKFAAYSKDLEANIAEKTALVTSLGAKVADAEATVLEMQSSVQDDQALVQTAVKGLEGLETMCVTGEKFGERKKQREREIEALKEALQILESWSD